MKYEKVHSIYNKLLAIEDIDPTLVYIQYMKFARRAEGIKSGRSIFKKAREDLRTRHHVYVTAALMEYYCSKVRTYMWSQPMCQNIFLLFFFQPPFSFPAG